MNINVYKKNYINYVKPTTFVHFGTLLFYVDNVYGTYSRVNKKLQYHEKELTNNSCSFKNITTPTNKPIEIVLPERNSQVSYPFPIRERDHSGTRKKPSLWE